MMNPSLLTASYAQTSDNKVNIVNADIIAKKRGLRVKETVVQTDGEAILQEMTVRAGVVAGNE